MKNMKIMKNQTRLYMPGLASSGALLPLEGALKRARMALLEPPTHGR